MSEEISREKVSPSWWVERFTIGVPPLSKHKFTIRGEHKIEDGGMNTRIIVTENGVENEYETFCLSDTFDVAMAKIALYCKKNYHLVDRRATLSSEFSEEKGALAREFERMTNKKNNYIHYVVNEIFKSYDVVFMEDLNVQGMLRNHSLAKAIQEVGFYRFKEVLQSKALANDKQVVFIDRFYPSSKTCSCCGYKHQGLKLSDRFWICPECGEHHDRDINAARNILLEGQRKLQAG